MFMRIAISAENTIDLPKELLDEYQIDVIPFPVILGDKTYNDGVLPSQDIFDYVEIHKVLPKTCALNEYQYGEWFKSLLEKNDAVIHITLSSGITSSIQNAIRAASNLKNVYVIDSKTLSTGIALLAIYARELANQGLEPNDIVNKVNSRVPSLQVSFVVNTLEYLHRGGRCSAAANFGANLLKLKPMIVVKSDGKMDSDKTFRGKNSIVIQNYCDVVFERFKNPDLSVGFVTHTMASPEMIEAAKNAMLQHGFKKVYVTVAGPTITSHCGPKTLGILFLNDGSQK